MRKKILKITSLICGVVCSVVLLMSSAVIASAATINVDEALYSKSELESINTGFNFLNQTYYDAGMEDTVIYVNQFIGLYDYNGIEIANLIVYERNEIFDYVITSKAIGVSVIFEYALNVSSDYIHKFNEHNYIYYNGTLDFCYKFDNNYYNLYNEQIDSDLWISQSIEFNNYVKNLSDTREAEIEFSGTATNGTPYEWIVDGSKIPSGISYKENYVTGITATGQDAKLRFFSMEEFKNYGAGYSEHCGPTALTNLLRYMIFRGYHNVYYHGSYVETFMKLATMAKWNCTTGTTMSNMKSAIQDYSKEMSLSYYYDSFFWGTSFYSFESSIDKNRPCIVLVNTTVSNNNWGHFMVVLGYKGYSTQSCNGTQNWEYLRVCDGWDTANSARYIKLNEGSGAYWSKVSGFNYMLK